MNMIKRRLAQLEARRGKHVQKITRHVEYVSNRELTEARKWARPYAGQQITRIVELRQQQNDDA